MINRRRSNGTLAAILILAVGLLPACASGGSGPRPAMEPAPAPPPAWGASDSGGFDAYEPQTTLAEAPATSIEENLEDAGYDPGRTYNLTVRDTDVRAVLLAIARESDLSIVIEPEVEGAVTNDIRGVTLPVLLESLLTPLGLQYRVESGVLKIRKRQFETRFLYVDIVQTERTGTRSLGVNSGQNGNQGGGGGNGGAGGNGGGAGGGNQAGGGGSSSVSSTDPGYIWDEMTAGIGFLMGAGFGGLGGGSYGYDPDEERRRRGGLGGFGGGLGGFGGGGLGGDGPALHVNRTTGTIMVRHYPDVLDEIGEYVRSIEEIAQRQVLIEAQIVEVTMRKEFVAGIDWGVVFNDLGVTMGQSVGASGVNVFQAALSRRDVNAVLGAMSNQGDVNVLSSPSVVTLNNQVALLSVGTQEVFFTSTTTLNNQGGLAQVTTQPGTVTNGVTLSVTPQVSGDGWVTMSIQPAISSLTGEAVGPNGDRFPIMDVRVTDNVIRVREGETIFIGGLLEDVIRETETKTPLLGDIPILGSLFRRTDVFSRKSDLIVMITPTVLKGERVRALMRDQLQRIEMRRRGSNARRGM